MTIPTYLPLSALGLGFFSLPLGVGRAKSYLALPPMRDKYILNDGHENVDGNFETKYGSLLNPAFEKKLYRFLTESWALQIQNPSIFEQFRAILVK